MERLLHLKHWQLFVLIFGVPFIGTIIYMFVLFGRIISMAQQGVNDPFFVFDIYGSFLPWMAIPMVFTLFLYLWMQTITDKATEVVEEYNPKKWMYRIALYMPYIFTIFWVVLMGLVFGSMADEFRDLDQGQADMPPASFFQMFGAMFMIIPIAIVVFILQIYAILETGRAAKTLQERRKTTYGESVLEIILVWFNFVGVWILQPKFEESLSKDKYVDELS